MAPRVSDTEVEPSHHLKLTDQDANDLGFIIVDGNGDPDPRAIARDPIPRTTIKTSQGNTKYSDFETPYTPVSQDDWMGGRGNEFFEDDRSRFYDSYRANTWKEGQVILGPIEKWQTGYRDIDQNMQGDVQFDDLAQYDLGFQTTRYWADAFVASASYTATKIRIWLRKNNKDADHSITVGLYSNSAGEPDTLLDSDTVAPTAVGTLSVLYEFDISQALTSGTTYWVVVDPGTPSVGHYWALGLDREDTSGGLSSLDGASWAASNGFYFRVTGTLSPDQFCWPFEYQQAMYMVINELDATAPRLYLNGYRGVATGATQSTTQMQDTNQSWTADALIGAVVLFTGGGDEKGQWSIITDNDGDTLTFAPAIDIAATAATTEYAVLGLDTWAELTGHGLTKPVTGIALLNDIVYFAQGDSTNIRRLRAQNNAGTWEDLGTTAATRADDATNQGIHLLTFMHDVDGLSMGLASNNDANGDTSFARADAQAWGTDLTFGTPIVCGDKRALITGMELYGEPEVPWVLKEDSVGAIIDDFFAPVPLREMANVRSEKNGRAHLVHGVYLYFSLLHSVQRYYRNNLDDIGPSRGTGLPDGRQGPIHSMVGYPGMFFLAVDAGASGDSSVLLNRGGHESYHEVYRCTVAGERIRKLGFQVIPGTVPDRLWVGVGGDIVALDWPSDTAGHYRDGNVRYTHESALTTSWIHIELRDANKYFDALKVFMDSSIAPLTGGTIKAEYQVDEDTDSDDWTGITDVFDALPVEEHELTSDDSLTGKRIRFRFILRSQRRDRTPRMTAYVLEALIKLTAKYSYSFNFRIGDEHINLEGDPDDYDRIETAIALLEAWADDARPLTMNTVFTPFDDKKVFVDPSSLRPENIIFDDQIEMHVGHLTVIDK